MRQKSESKIVKRPLFLERIHDREKKEKEEIEYNRKRMALLALDIAEVLLKAGSSPLANKPCKTVRSKKDIWSHLGDFFFGK